MGGLDRPSSGSIEINGLIISGFDRKELTTFRRDHVGFVFQQFHMIPYLNVLENVLIAQYFHSIVDEDEALAVLEKVGMTHRLNHYPNQLSGGEKQRVCIARALINQPELILADEPTGNLDEKNERLVVDIFRRMHTEGHTIILATHDSTIGGESDRIIKLNHGKLVHS
jgi:putative ABC transport system ATP-binding protein